MVKERIFLLIVIVLCVLMVIFSNAELIAKLIGILMLLGIWFVFDNLYEDVFKKEDNSGFR